MRGALSPHKAHIEYKSAAAATGKGTGPKEIRAQWVENMDRTWERRKKQIYSKYIKRKGLAPWKKDYSFWPFDLLFLKGASPFMCLGTGLAFDSKDWQRPSWCCVCGNHLDLSNHPVTIPHSVFSSFSATMSFGAVFERKSPTKRPKDLPAAAANEGMMTFQCQDGPTGKKKGKIISARDTAVCCQRTTERLNAREGYTINGWHWNTNGDKATDERDPLAHTEENKTSWLRESDTTRY